MVISPLERLHMLRVRDLYGVWIWQQLTVRACLPLQSKLMYKTSACLWCNCLHQFFPSVGQSSGQILPALYLCTVSHSCPWDHPDDQCFRKWTITDMSFYLLLVSFIHLTIQPLETSGCSSVSGMGVRIQSWEGWDDCKMPSLLKKLLGWIPSLCNIESKLITLWYLKWQFRKPHQMHTLSLPVHPVQGTLWKLTGLWAW